MTIRNLPRCDCLAVSLASLATVLHGTPALAHTSERAFVLTLPSELYILGGALAVAATFLLVALLPAAPLLRLERIGRPLGRIPQGLLTSASLVSALVMVGLILAGRFGSQDPLGNPLPLTVWTLWWVGLTLAHALLGNLWAGLNPWLWIFRLTLFQRLVERPLLRYPDWLGVWPAVLQFLGFAWFELIYLAPQNPAILADAVSAYFLVNLLAVSLFGPADWLRRGEAFGVFFRMVAWLSPLNGRPQAGPPARGSLPDRTAVATLPGLGLLHLRPLSPSGVAFVLLALAAVSFEGLAITWWWLARLGVNPLEFPGRSAVTIPNSLGLLAVFLLWLSAYLAAVGLGHLLSGRAGSLRVSLGRQVVALVPIALAYHFAHYLTAFLVDAQYAAILFNDPLGRGWDLFGLAGARVTTSFLNDYDSVRLIWHAQVAAIVLGHLLAVAIAHVIALLAAEDAGAGGGGGTGRRAAVLAQLPMTLLMVGYTLFGLWLLSTPAIG